MSPVPSTKLRVVTYNIHKGIGGVDRRYDLARIAGVLAHIEADLVLLQEVDEGVPRSRGDRQVELLAAELGYPHWAYQKNVRLKRGHYGNAILSHLPLPETWDLDLSIRFKKRRQALVAKTHVDVGEHRRTLLVCNAHLGLAGFERTMQIRRLLAFDPIANLHESTPAVVGGDFNDVWSSHGRLLMFPEGYQCAVRRAKTFPAAYPMRSLDAIYYRGTIELTSSYVAHTKLAKQASDHRPVVADFEVT